jgi:hypothetical protein
MTLRQQTNEQLIAKFSGSFPSNDRGTTFGFPSDRIKINRLGQKKRQWDYTTFRRGYRPLDVSKHLSGSVAIVASPFLPDGRSVSWAAFEEDDYTIDLAWLEHSAAELGLVLHVFPSKSGGPHCYVFFSEPRPAYLVRRLLRGWAAKLSFRSVEVFPKQDEIADSGKVGNNIQLPFFGDRAGLDRFQPRLYDVPPEQWELAPIETPSSITYEDSSEPGYWDVPALEAMLKALKADMPHFRCHRSRKGYAVLCPGQTEIGWPDGNRHSTDKAGADWESAIWIENGWPAYRCFHQHCSEPKKTFTDWLDFWDPLRRRFDFDQWQAEETAKAEQHFLAEYGGASCQR